MAYKRQWRPSHTSESSSKSRISIHWSDKSSAYALKFCEPLKWEQMKILIGYIKNIPVSERDYDPENKIWFFVEKHLLPIKQMIEALSQYFELDFIQKPIGQTNTHQFISVDIYLENFKNLTGYDIKGQNYDEAKKLYRKACRENHPDLHRNDTIDYGMIMSSINECWTVLVKEYFKLKKDIEYEQVSS